MTIFKSNISGTLQELMRRKGLSMPELARRAHVPQPTIYRIVQGDHLNPHKKTLRALSDFFNITIDQLIGLEPIDSLIEKNFPVQLPLLTCKEAVNWPGMQLNNTEHIIFEKTMSKNGFALKMTDKSMESLIPKNSIIILDPEKRPEYRNIVAVKLHNFDELIIRQLIKDAGNCYIKPLNQDFDQFKILLLTDQDEIRGTAVEIRLNCEEL